MKAMRILKLNSFCHYRVKRAGNYVEIVEYPDDCPKMDDTFNEESGEVIAVFQDGEEVVFCGTLFNSKVDADKFDSRGSMVW